MTPKIHKGGSQLEQVYLTTKTPNFIKELLEFPSNSEVRTLAEIEAELFRIMKAFIRELIKAYIQITDEAILKDKSSRKERGLVVERCDDKRSVYTIFGNISFKRTYYFDKKHKKYVYPMDEALRLDKYERLKQSCGHKAGRNGR